MEILIRQDQLDHDRTRGWHLADPDDGGPTGRDGQYETFATHAAALAAVRARGDVPVYDWVAPPTEPTKPSWKARRLWAREAREAREAEKKGLAMARYYRERG